VLSFIQTLLDSGYEVAIVLRKVLGEIPVATQRVGLESGARFIVSRIQNFPPDNDLIPEAQGSQVEHDQINLIRVQDAPQIGGYSFFQLPQPLFRQAIPDQDADVNVAERAGTSFSLRAIEVGREHV
jgi:hypothetical protein